MKENLSFIGDDYQESVERVGYDFGLNRRSFGFRSVKCLIAIIYPCSARRSLPVEQSITRLRLSPFPRYTPCELISFLNIGMINISFVQAYGNESR